MVLLNIEDYSPIQIYNAQWWLLTIFKYPLCYITHYNNNVWNGFCEIILNNGRVRAG